MMTGLIDDDGLQHTSTEDFCEVFGAFYEKLYMSADGEDAGVAARCKQT